MTSDDIWSAVNAEVIDMQRTVWGDGNVPDPLASFTPAQRTLVRIYATTAWRLAVQREHDELQDAIREAIAGG